MFGFGKKENVESIERDPVVVKTMNSLGVDEKGMAVLEKRNGGSLEVVDGVICIGPDVLKYKGEPISVSTSEETQEVVVEEIKKEVNSASAGGVEEKVEKVEKVEISKWGSRVCDKTEALTLNSELEIEEIGGREYWRRANPEEKGRDVLVDAKTGYVYDIVETKGHIFLRKGRNPDDTSIPRKLGDYINTKSGYNYTFTEKDLPAIKRLEEHGMDPEVIKNLTKKINRSFWGKVKAKFNPKSKKNIKTDNDITEEFSENNSNTSDIAKEPDTSTTPKKPSPIKMVKALFTGHEDF